MPVTDRRLDRGSRRADRSLREFAAELRRQRHASGLSQRAVAGAAHIDRARYSRIEGARIPKLGIAEASRLAAVLGLDLVVRCYPGGERLRDAGHLQLVSQVREAVRPPLRLRVEVPLPRLDGRDEARAWDAEITALGARTTIEFETRLYDAQDQERRIALKRRDDPADRFLLVVADTRANRQVLALHPELWPELSRVRARDVIGALREGRHPPTGIVLLKRS
jgi:transcriptional regulator with XRE-family HTH domain